MRYNPRRDIPKAARELRTTSPTQIAEWIKNHRTETDAYGKKRQVVRFPQSVTMWFKDHPDALKQLEAEITQDIEAYEGLNEVIFENGNFRELPSIKNWIRPLLELRARPHMDNQNTIIIFSFFYKMLVLYRQVYRFK